VLPANINRASRCVSDTQQKARSAFPERASQNLAPLTRIAFAINWLNDKRNRKVAVVRTTSTRHIRLIFSQLFNTVDYFHESICMWFIFINAFFSRKQFIQMSERATLKIFCISFVVSHYPLPTQFMDTNLHIIKLAETFSSNNLVRRTLTIYFACGHRNNVI